MRASICCCLLASVSAFSPTFRAPLSRRAVRGFAPVMEMGEELEFIIHADGRVEERVRGVKGIDCQSLTEVFNKELGEVYESKPTAEMFEQKVELTVDAEATVSESWTGSGSWGSDGCDSGSSGSQW